MVQPVIRREDTKRRKYGKGIRREIPDRNVPLSQFLDFRENLKWLNDRFGVVSVSKTLGVSNQTVWRHIKGVNTLPTPFLLLDVNHWAEVVRQQDAKKASQNPVKNSGVGES